MKILKRICMYRTVETYVAPIGSMALCADGEMVVTFREAETDLAAMLYTVD